jgi:ABC-type transport system substrate-binding protein
VLLAPVIKSFAKVNDETVEAQLNQLPASFLPRFARSSLQLLPAHLDLDTVSKKAFGTGPFKLKSFERDTVADWGRNPDYYLKDEQGRQLPYLDGIRYFVFTDRNLELAALRTGRLRHTTNVNFDIFHEVISKQGIFTDKVVGGTFGIIFKNFAPFNDRRVLEAIDLWLDRKLYVDIGFLGLGWPWDAGMLPAPLGGQWALPEQEIMSRPGYRYLDASGKLVTNAEEAWAKWKELRKDPADLARAKELLLQAGVKRGDVKFEVTAGTVHITRTAPVFVAQMKELFGATWTLRLLGRATQNAEILEGRFSVNSIVGGGTTPEPGASLTGWLWDSANSSGSPAFKAAGWPRDDPGQVKIQQRYDQQEYTFDEQKRRELIGDLLHAILDRRPNIHTNMSIGIVTWWPEFRGYPNHIQSGLYEIQERYDRVWIAQ